MKAKIYIGAKKYALYIGRKIVQKTLEFLTLPARFVSKKVQELKNYLIYGQSVQSNLPSGYEEYSSVTDTNGIVYTAQNGIYPAKRLLDNTFGLYDTNTQKFRTEV